MARFAGGPAKVSEQRVGTRPSRLSFRGLRRQALAPALSGAGHARAFEVPRDEVETRRRGFDVFRFVVALAGLAAFLALPVALVLGVALLLRW